MSYSSEVLADSPLVYLKLDETSGTTAADSSGNSRDFTNANATVNQSPLISVGRCYDFNGSSAQVSLVDASWQRPSAFTVEAWINADSVSFNAVGAKDAAGGGWAFYISSGKVNAFVPGAGSHAGSTTLSTGVTYHVVMTYDSGTAKVYVNGSLDGTFTGLAVVQTSATPLLVGVATGSNADPTRNFWFDGRIDEWAYYGTALSGTRIAAHYAAGTTTPPSGAGSLTLSGSGTATAPATGSGSISLSGSGAAKAAAVGAGAIALSGAGAIDFQPASGSGSIALSGTGATGIGVAGSGAIALTGSGTVAGATGASGSGDVTLSGLGFATLAAGGSGSITLGAVGTAFALFVTDLTNALNGRRRRARGTATVTRTAAPPPPGRTFAKRYDKAIAYPMPDMIDGRAE